MMPGQNIFSLARLIANHIKGTAGRNEEAAVGEWRDASAENAAFLEHLSQNSFFEEKYIAQQLCNVDGAYRSFCDRTRRYRTQRRMRRIVAAVSGAAAATVVAVMLFTGTPGREHATPPITPGSSLAILTTGNGADIPLGGKAEQYTISEGDVSVTVSGDGIVYDGGSESSAGIFNTLSVPRKGEYRVVLSDGTQVWINSESRLRYPSSFSGGERTVYLEGEAFFEVAHDSERPFTVVAGESRILALGTSFNVNAYEDNGCIYATLVTGRVRVSAGHGEVELAPGEQGIVDVATGTIDIRTVNVDVYAGWKEGLFLFEDQPLEEIMNSLARWYDLEVVFEKESARRAGFNGKLMRYEDFTRITDMLELTGMVNFIIDGNKITIR